jgi:hypothetical protein
MADHKTQVASGFGNREYEHHRDRAMMHEDRSEIMLEKKGDDHHPQSDGRVLGPFSSVLLHARLDRILPYHQE